MKKALVSLFLMAAMLLTCVSAYAIYDVPEQYEMPISDGSVTLTVYMAMGGGSEKALMSYDDHPAIKKWSEATGVNFHFIHPPANDDGTYFNTIIASGELPDIWICNGFKDWYAGGIEGAIADGVLTNLNEYIEKYGYHYLTEAHKNWDDQATRNFMTDSGMYRFGAAAQRVPVLGQQHQGFVVRSDVMEELGLEMPKTISELHDLLVAFKNYGFEVPLVLEALEGGWYADAGFLAGWTGTNSNGFVIGEDGKVTHSMKEPGFKTYLQTLKDWYKEGLIDIDAVSRTHDDVKAMVTSGRSAMMTIGNWETKEAIIIGKASVGENFELKGMPFWTADGVDYATATNPFARPIQNGTSTIYWGISSTCKEKEIAFKALDWLYSYEGAELMVFGPTEYKDMLHPESGETVQIHWTNEDGTREFSDYILNNPELAYNSIRTIYTIQDLSSEYASEMEYMQYGEECHAQCWNAWTSQATDDRHVPSTITMTVDEATVHNRVMNDVNTYLYQRMYNIIFGEDTVDNWDSYVEQAVKLGLDEAIAITQSANDRYYSR